MQKILIFVALLVAGIATRAQGPRTLIGDFSSVSGFGGFMSSIQPVAGNYTVLTGGGGAVLLGNQFYFGGYGLGLSDDIVTEFDGTQYEVEYGHGGFMLGYIIRPFDLIHFGISSKLGWGGIEFYEELPSDEVFRSEDNVFVVHPQVEAEVNFTRWFKVNVGVGYSKAIGVDNIFYDSSDFDGTAVGVSLLFGWF